MHWLFNKLDPLSDDGRNTVYDHFKDEDKKLVETFVREFFQNYLDALPPEATGKLVIKLLEGTRIDKTFNKSILRELEGRLEASNKRAQIEPYSLDLDNPKVLTLEEFHTYGLTGQKENIITNDEEERWSNYWHGTAKQSKSSRNLGSAGQGKITCCMVSKAYTVLALTRPLGEEEDFIFGKTSFRHTYVYSEREKKSALYGFNAFWCDSGYEGNAFPEKSLEAIDRFKKAYSLQRQAETGTSWVIPAVRDEINKDALIRATLKEFYVPIYLNKMELNICGVKICQSDIPTLIQKYYDESMPSIEYFKFFEEAALFNDKDFYSLKNKWWKEDELTENNFEEEFEEIKEEFENKKCIGFKVPIEVCPKGESVKKSFIRVWIQLREENKSEFSYCRRFLLISKEPRSHRIAENAPLLAFVQAEDDPIAGFLSNAEEPSHLNWNRKMDKLEDYHNSDETLGAVRKSLKSIYGVLRTASQERDDNALIDILSIPGKEKKKVKKSTEKKKKKKGEEEKPKPIIEKTKPFLIVDDGNGIRVKPGPLATDEVNYPVSCMLTAAYHNIEIAGDSYKNYHPFDFDFNESFRQISVQSRNIVINEKNENQIKFEIDNKDFLLELKGFRADRQIRAKVGYKLS
jgi:hypothetical protein